MVETFEPTIRRIFICSSKKGVRISSRERPVLEHPPILTLDERRHLVSSVSRVPVWHYLRMMSESLRSVPTHTKNAHFFWDQNLSRNLV